MVVDLAAACILQSVFYIYTDIVSFVFINSPVNSLCPTGPNTPIVYSGGLAKVIIARALLGDSSSLPADLLDTTTCGDWRVFRSEHQLLPVGFVVFEESAVDSAIASAGGGRLHRPPRPFPRIPGRLQLACHQTSPIPPPPPTPTREDQELQTALQLSVATLASDTERLDQARQREEKEFQQVIELSMTSAACSSSSDIEFEGDLDLMLALELRYISRKHFFTL